MFVIFFHKMEKINFSGSKLFYIPGVSAATFFSHVSSGKQPLDSMLGFLERIKHGGNGTTLDNFGDQFCLVFKLTAD